MEYNTNEKNQEKAVYVEPVKVEDCPLPVRLRAWEAAKKTARAIRQKMRGKGVFRAAIWLAALAIGMAVLPAMLIWTLIGSRGRSRRAAGMAFRAVF